MNRSVSVAGSRLFRESDVPVLVKLWEEETPWGEVSYRQWRRWHLDTPNGSCLIVVIVDEDDVAIGQLVLVPARVSLGNEEIAAVRIAAPILRRSSRSERLLDPDHPLVRGLRFGLDAAARRGFSVAYAFPDPGWLPFFDWIADLGLEFSSVEYDCVAIRTDLARTGAPPNGLTHSARTVTAFGPEYDALWQAARESFAPSCMVVRDPAWLRWKNPRNTVIEVREKEGKLVGYASVRDETNLLVDLLARKPQELPDVLAAVLDRCASGGRRGANGSPEVLKAMRTPALAPALDSLGFEPDDYTFLFVCRAIGEGPELSRARADRWYIMPRD